MKIEHNSHKQKPNLWQKLQRSAKRFVAGKEALHDAVKAGKLKEVENLAKNYDYDINSYDVYGYPPLRQSIKYDHYQIILWLLQNPDIDVNKFSNPNKAY